MEVDAGGAARLSLNQAQLKEMGKEGVVWLKVHADNPDNNETLVDQED